MRRRVCAVLGAVVLVAFEGVDVGVTAQHVHPSAATPQPKPPAADGTITPRRVSEDELHSGGGVPRGWRFTIERGDVARGRQAFADLECYKCHAIAGETFPAPADGKYLGPELTGMGRMHPAEYIAESVLFPNNVIVDETGYSGPDGRSVMPSYADSLTVTQWLDVVAYLKNLTEGGEHPAGHGVERVATAGDYRIRLVYAAGGHGAHAGHGTAGAPATHGGHAMAPARKAGPRPAGHLMAFITERETGEAVPYLPVTAVVQGPGGARQTLTLRPMISQSGFHYGADATLADRTEKVTLTIGATTMSVAASAKGRFTKPVSAVIDWSAAPR